jgi:hypothetical protein
VRVCLGALATAALARFFITLWSELADPFVGPAIRAETGTTYVTTVTSATRRAQRVDLVVVTSPSSPQCKFMFSSGNASVVSHARAPSHLDSFAALASRVDLSVLLFRPDRLRDVACGA